MKFNIFAIALFCIFAYVSARAAGDFGSQYALSENEDTGLPHRPKREANPQGSVVLQGTKPLSGPDRRPSLDLNYNQRVYDGQRGSVDTYGGVNVRPGQAAQPHFGVQARREYRNGFIEGYGQVQRGHHGRPDPTAGIRGGFRFRRDIDDIDFEDDVLDY